MLERKGWMMLPLRVHKRLVRCLWGAERPKVQVFPINLNASLPLTGTKCAGAHEAGIAVASDLALVPAVVLCRHVSQVGNAVVVSDTVDVVNVSCRPDAMNVKPGKPMLTVLSALDADVSVSLRHRHEACPRAFRRKLIAVDFVGESARFRVIVQKLFQQVLRECNVWLSHVIAPFKRRIGQGIDAGANCLFPRNIIGGIA